MGWKLGLLPLVVLAGCAQGGTGPLSPALQAAAANYPPMILGGNVHATDGLDRPVSCAAAGSRTEQKGGPTINFGGTDPSDSDLCLMTIEGQPMKAWYDIWAIDWPGAADARTALRKVITGPSGTVAGFDTRSAPGLQWHDFVRNEGIEDIALLGKAYHTLKISHYREGMEGDNYRSVSTVWKDIPTGMLVYGTYQHIAGQPELDDPLIPTAIIPAK
jgi:hypothetical protein